jgi:Putative zinc-finger
VREDAARDRALDELLKRLGDTPAGAASDECLEADTLAAWADGALPGDRLAAIETHAAGCARCQAMLAAMVRTAPAGERPASRWHAWKLVGWGAPLAAAAALVLWVVVGREGQPASPAAPAPTFESRQAAERDRAAAPPPATIAPAVPPPAQPTARRAAPAAPRPSAAQEQRTRAEEPARSAELAASEARRANPNDLAGRAGAGGAGRGGGRGGAGGVAGGTSAVVAPPAPAVAAPTTPPPPPPPATAPVREADALAARAFSSVAPEFSSPDGSVRWRPAGASVVERSGDGGRTWQQVALDAAVTVRAGSAPSSDVCWLVGPAGVVLLSTDGRTFRRLRFPEPADLTSVRATDARRAVVTTADGRRFATTDGGDTWLLQETPAAAF